MDHVSRIREHFSASAQLKLDAAESLAPAIARAAETMTACLFADGRILCCGNGGSASDAMLQSIDLAVAAEEVGADGAYFRVHHFARQLSSP